MIDQQIVGMDKLWGWTNCGDGQIVGMDGRPSLQFAMEKLKIIQFQPESLLNAQKILAHTYFVIG